MQSLSQFGSHCFHRCHMEGGFNILSNFLIILNDSTEMSQAMFHHDFYCSQKFWRLHLKHKQCIFLLVLCKGDFYSISFSTDLCVNAFFIFASDMVENGFHVGSIILLDSIDLQSYGKDCEPTQSRFSENFLKYFKKYNLHILVWKINYV